MFLKAENINFEYAAGKRVLNGVSIALDKSKTLAIVGASGCGKSTFLRIISGILPQIENNTLDGQISINDKTPDQYRKSGKLGFMFQEPTLMPNLTVKENISLPLKITGIKDEKRVEKLLRTVGLEDYANYLPKQLSGGMKTRVALARSFVTGPELLLLDEPFSALDIAWKSKLYVELEKLREQFHTTVIFVTHDVQEALLLSNNVIVLGKSGTILHKDKIQTDFSISDRVLDISNFIKTATYQEHFILIQKWIMDDGVRAITGRYEVDKILDRISQVAGNGNELWDSFKTDIVSIREHSNDSEVNSILIEAFRKAKSIDFKQELIWDILNYDKVSESIKKEIFEFYFSNIKQISAKATNYYQASANTIFDVVVESRIKGSRNKYPKEKLFIYLCDLYHSNESERVLNYLDEVKAGAVEQLDYPLAKEVAQKIGERITNEKMDALHIA